MRASEPTGARPPARDRGLTYVLGATVVAGAVGYVIQAAVPAFTGTDEYIAFSVFWSVVYLIVSALSGIQNELTRSAHPTADREGSGWRSPPTRGVSQTEPIRVDIEALVGLKQQLD